MVFWPLAEKPPLSCVVDGGALGSAHYRREDVHRLQALLLEVHIQLRGRLQAETEDDRCLGGRARTLNLKREL